MSAPSTLGPGWGWPALASGRLSATSIVFVPSSETAAEHMLGAVGVAPASTLVTSMEVVSAASGPASAVIADAHNHATAPPAPLLLTPDGGSLRAREPPAAAAAATATASAMDSDADADAAAHDCAAEVDVDAELRPLQQPLSP